jgi:cell division protein FtsB
MNDGQLRAPPRKRRRVRSILAVAAAVVVVGALAGITTIALLRNATLSSQVAMADARAANAVRAAQAAAQKDYAARNAALNREAATLNRKSQTIAAEIGELQANTIRADGIYVVGHDIKPGTWHTVGDGHVSGGLCRFAMVGSANRPNNPTPTLFDGPWTVNLSAVYAFEIYGPCTWIREP